jgi:hypothetical protein
VPSIVDDSLAPAGKYVINVFGGHAPYRLKDNASWKDQKPNLTRAALEVIDEMAPGFSAQVIDVETLVAPDLEAIVALPQGTHLSRRALPRSAVLAAPRAALVRLPHTGEGPVPVRRIHASGGRGVGHSRSQTPHARSARIGEASEFQRILKRSMLGICGIERPV